VDVHLGIVGQVVVDDVADALDIKPGGFWLIMVWSYTRIADAMGWS
jgi:hypothetical protein